MTDNRKTTVPGASVGADAVQSSSKINTNIITNSGKQINLQAAKKSNNFGLNTISMTELYDTVYPPRKPIVNDLLYSGTYLFVGAPKVGKSFVMGQLAYHVAMGLPLWEYEVHQSQGMEALQMLIGGFVIFMIPQVVGGVVVLLELAAVMLRQVWYI